MYIEIKTPPRMILECRFRFATVDGRYDFCNLPGAGQVPRQGPTPWHHAAHANDFLQICPKNCDFRCFAKFDQLVGCALFWHPMGPTRCRDYNGCCQGKESNTAGMGRALFIIDNPGTTAIRMGSESFFSEASPVFVAKDNQG